MKPIGRSDAHGRGVFEQTNPLNRGRGRNFLHQPGTEFGGHVILRDPGFQLGSKRLVPLRLANRTLRGIVPIGSTNDGKRIFQKRVQGMGANPIDHLVPRLG